MSKPIHTPGPVSISLEGKDYGPAKRLYLIAPSFQKSDDSRWFKGHIIADIFPFKDNDPDRDNARLLAAAYNAFDSAGRKLGWNAVLFAEAAQNGGIADLVDALISAERFIAKQSGGGETEFRASLLSVLRKVNPGVQA